MLTKVLRCILYMGAVLLGSAVAMRAAVLLDDSFGYPNGLLVTASGGKWINHSGTVGEVDVTSGRVNLDASETEDVHAQLSGQPYPAAGTTNVFYASFVVRFTSLPSTGGDYFAHFNTASTMRARVWAFAGGATPGKFRLGISSTSGSVISVTNPTELSLDTDYVVVTRLANTNCTGTLWIDPATEGDASVATTETAATATVVNYSFRQTSGIGTCIVDDLKVGTAFSEVVGPTNLAPTLVASPQDQSVGEGATVNFGIRLKGTPPLRYQWWFNTTNLLSAATNQTFVLTSVLTNQSGAYSVTVSNAFGVTNSQPATLTVSVIPPYLPAALSLLTYNVKGNGATNWSPNAPQVQAIGRQLSYLQPDIITFQEIPYDLSYEMTNFMIAFLPGYALARNSGTDGAIRSMIASRFPITRSTSWLDSTDLRAFGYSNANNSLDNFTRDLFEAEVAVPHFPQPLHVFTTHLKSSFGTNYADAAAKRAAEAAAITNFFATNLFILYPTHPYVLTGDMNDGNSGALAIQMLISASTGLRLTAPTNLFTGSLNTFGSERIDFIFPCGLLFSNLNNSQVFRADQLDPTPPQIQAADAATASDHWPVLMVFNNPYDQPFKLLSIARSNATVTLQWESVPGQPYRVDAAADLSSWGMLASNLTATSNTCTFSTNLNDATRYFRVYRVP